jgi:hypothetical protein
VSFILGKVFLLLILVVFIKGVFRRIGSDMPPPVQKPQPLKIILSPWLYALLALLAAVETGLLAEAVHLPLRFDQPGFDKLNWLLVVVVLAVLFGLQLLFTRTLLLKRYPL